MTGMPGMDLPCGQSSPTCWRRSPRPGRSAAVHSIREIVRHVTFWYDGVRRRLGGEVVEADEVEQWPDAVDAGEAGWQQELDDLERAHKALVEAAGKLGDDDLERPVPGKPYNAYVLLHGLVQHNLYHAGQVAILKRAASG